MRLRCEAKSRKLSDFLPSLQTVEKRNGAARNRLGEALNFFYKLEGMFILNPPESPRWMEEQDSYPTLDAAIEAALNAHMDLDRAIIQKENVATVSVNRQERSRQDGY